jgi:hypothetical protein
MLGGGPAELNKAIDAERGRMVKAVKHANIKD